MESVGTVYIEKGQPWENGYIESFNSRFRYEVLNRELFYSVKEAKIIVEAWRLDYNIVISYNQIQLWVCQIFFYVIAILEDCH
ncbi:unnamed protein product, partial [marine sediment metagenome]